MSDDPHVCALCDEYPCTCSPVLVCPYCGCDDLDILDDGRGVVRCLTCGGEFV